MNTQHLYIFIRRILTYAAAAYLMTPILTACSTGIESTKKIQMTKEDVRLMARSPEQTLTQSIQGTPLSSWEKGHRFLAMSDRTLFIFEPVGQQDGIENQSLSGRILTYTGTDSHINPDLREECVILFSDGTRTFRYPTGKTTDSALSDIESSRLPLLADIELVDRWKEKLSGLSLWTRSNIWYDEDGQRGPGMKFAKVKVEEVEATDGDLPMKIKVSTPDGQSGFLYMNYTSDIHDSRNFPAVFYLSDPKDRYPQISDEHWKMIQKGKVVQGMTKEECKLSLGNPDEVRSGHNRSSTMDIWQYADGTYLMFTDGLLTNFRQ